MNGFRKRLELAIHASPEYRSNIYRLSADAGLGQKTLYNILHDKKTEAANKGPGIFGLARVASLLNVSLDYLAGLPDEHDLETHIKDGIKAQTLTQGGPMSADALLRLHAKSGGQIAAFAPWIDHCDQYLPPNPADTTLTVKAVGAKSLSSLTMGTCSADLLQTALATVKPEELRQGWLSDYRTASERGTLSTIEHLDVQMPNHPVKVHMTFIRCLLGVIDTDQSKTILNFSLLVA